ncbi:NAD(P)/FAD-dependent oxidoreductase [Pusillimonas sp. ANT_WB101]|uniref:NAD(P)/FAD-dependent oxidoreductase n=1 Tax=Pusillimonas sp. ANT_WB101 TaxID=2597356 RepID=UPI00351A967E
MMAAAVAGQRGLRVVLIDHAKKLAEKIRISGGGRCNFTNINTSPANFISQNPHFCRSALAAYTPQDFIDMVVRHGIAWHEKHRGQLFCDESSEDIITMLQHECDDGRVSWRMPCAVERITRVDDDVFVLHTSQGEVQAHQLVMATGGMAIPQLGATDFALGVARQFGLKVIEPRPALVPLTFDAEAWKPFSSLSGVALEVLVRAVGAGAAAARKANGRQKPGGKAAQTEFLEDLLFTHRGLSGPAILQISSYWNPGEAISVDLAPGRDLARELLESKQGSRQKLGSVLSGMWPKRLADQWLANAQTTGDGLGEQRLADVPDKTLRELGACINAWQLFPSGTAGYKKAEVMRGGVDTRCLNQKTMEASAVSGLYFIGEAVDVTGWLGGYNFQWAWASGVACGKALLQHGGKR